jgi:hypothetical protein
LAEVAVVSDRIGQQKGSPHQKRPQTPEVEGQEVEAMVTVTGPLVGGNEAGVIVTETFPATVRTRLVYEGRPMFLAADPPVEVESEVAS